MPYIAWKIWIQAARPKTLHAGVAPVLIGSAMAYADGHFLPAIFALVIFAVLMIQIGTNYANDYYDYIKGADTKDRLGPVRATQAGLVTPLAMRNAFIIAFGLAIAAGVYLVFVGGLPIIIIGLISVACGILYTAGSWALGYLGLGDLFVLVFFGPVAVGGTYYLQTDRISFPVIVAGLAPGLISTALLAINNIRDYAADKTAGKKTIVVRRGVSFGIAEYYLCIIVACLVPIFLWLYTQSHIYCNLAVITLLFAVGPMKKLHTRPDGHVMNQLLAQTGQLVLMYSLLFSIGWLL